MAGTNFQQWNPGASNQENDAAYTADVLRSGGLQQGNIVPGPTLNKVLYQASVLGAAFGIMMANKGYSTSDGDVNVLAAVLAHIRLDNDFAAPFKAYGFAPSINLDFSAAETHQVFLSDHCSITISNVSPGQVRRIAYVQDAAGGHTIAYITGTGGAPVLGGENPAPDANSVSVQEFYVDGSGTLRAITAPSVT